MRRLSIIVPLFNEAASLPKLYREIVVVADSLPYDFELLFVNDGSRDGSAEIIDNLHAKDPRVRQIEFTRNFGKEVAVSAGLRESSGDVAIIMDADLQHPPALIARFISEWEAGAEMVVGVRETNHNQPLFKRVSSHFFNKLINIVAEDYMVKYGTDYRLLDRVVIDEFNRFTERRRLTRGLLDWLGFRTVYIHFSPNSRKNGKARYSYIELTRLAVNSLVSHSLFPLRLSGYLGIIITVFSLFLGLFVLVNRFLLSDHWHLNITGTAMLALLILFLIGIILICLGLIALYIANIHNEVINRPMYVIRKKN